MAKIALICLYEANYLGTRVLSSFLNSKGHSVHNILFKDFAWMIQDNAIEDHIGYQCLTNFNISTVNYDHRLWTTKEAKLLELRLMELAPEIVGISSRSPMAPLVEMIVPHVRNILPTSLLVAGGFGPTLSPEQYLDFGFDIVIRGDGEESLLDLANSVDKREVWTSVSNLVYRDEGKVVFNQLRPQTKDISIFPPPDYNEENFSFIDNDILSRNIDPLYMRNIAIASQGLYSTFISRGCVKHCSYCSGGHWTSLYRESGAKSYKTRKRNLDTVLDELENIDKNNFFHVNFVDECNTLTTNEILYFYPEYKKRVGLPFTSYLNYEKMINNPDLLELIVDCGLCSTGVGVQTGSESFAMKFYNRKNNNSLYSTLLQMLFRYRVVTYIHFIQGNCYEDNNSFRESLNLIKSFPFDPLYPGLMSLLIFQLRAFPRSPLLEIAPKITTNPMSAKEWHRRSLLMHIRQFANDEEIEYAINNKSFANDPRLLTDYGKRLLHDIQIRTMESMLPELLANDVVFFGCGKNFKKHYPYFHENSLIPKAIIVDNKYRSRYPEKVEDIPVFSLEECGKEIASCKIVSFAKKSNLVIRNLVSHYGINQDNIIACVPDAPLS